MHRIPYSPSITPRLAALFPPDRPIPVRLWAILDGAIQGRILVNQPDAPTSAVVQELAEGTTYIGGAATPQLLNDSIALLRQKQEVVICCWHDDPLIPLLPPTPYYDGTAIDFTDRTPTVDLSQLSAPPSNFQLHRINQEIVPLLEGFDYYISMFGSVERALQQTIGCCLLHDGRVVSEAIAGPLTKGIAEIGVGTIDSYRQRGLATVTAARVIYECEAHGYQPFWNASEQNLPSVALAKRLGFQTARPFRVLAWSHTPQN